MPNDLYSLPLNMLVAEQQNLARPDAVRVAVIGSMISSSTPMSLAMTLMLARREAPTASSGGVIVPNVLELKADAATKVLEDAKFKVGLEKQNNERIKESFLISQDPAGDTRAPEGSKVTLVVSTGRPGPT